RGAPCPPLLGDPRRPPGARPQLGWQRRDAGRPGGAQPSGGGQGRRRPGRVAAPPRRSRPRTVFNPQDVHLLGIERVVGMRRRGTGGMGKRVLFATAPAAEMAEFDLYQEFAANRREFRVSVLSGRVVSAYLRRPPASAGPEDLRRPATARGRRDRPPGRRARRPRPRRRARYPGPRQRPRPLPGGQRRTRHVRGYRAGPLRYRAPDPAPEPALAMPSKSGRRQMDQQRRPAVAVLEAVIGAPAPVAPVSLAPPAAI